jgi:hypothetical protein
MVRKEYKSGTMKFPKAHCPKNKTGDSHLFTKVLSLTVAQDIIWLCTYCGVAKWLPTGFDEAREFSTLIGRVGIDKAYGIELEKRPVIKEALINLKALIEWETMD